MLLFIIIEQIDVVKIGCKMLPPYLYCSIPLSDNYAKCKSLQYVVGTGRSHSKVKKNILEVPLRLSLQCQPLLLSKKKLAICS